MRSIGERDRYASRSKKAQHIVFCFHFLKENRARPVKEELQLVQKEIPVDQRQFQPEEPAKIDIRFNLNLGITKADTVDNLLLFPLVVIFVAVALVQ